MIEQSHYFVKGIANFSIYVTISGTLFTHLDAVGLLCECWIFFWVRAMDMQVVLALAEELLTCAGGAWGYKGMGQHAIA